LSLDSPDAEELKDEQYLELLQEATDLYGLIHARFIVSPQGLAIMREKYLSGRFGVCPRVMCEKQNVLPIGMSEDLHTSRVKIFCPRCEDVYIPKQRYADVDGAYFGTSFPHMLLQSYDDLQPQAPSSVYLPRLYGFQVYGRKGSKYQKAVTNSGTI
jgi:casein kinase II subunit beta